MKVLVTGAGGQVGHDLLTVFEDEDVVGADRAMLDVTDRTAVRECATATKPDVIVHAAAWTDVDGCESDPERAIAVNGLGTRHVAEAAREVGAWLCTFSTDYVFDGEKPEPYTESDAPNPRSVYGASKLAGEHEVAHDANAAILRISWVCGRHGRNMVKTILRLAGEHETLSFVDDQRGNPTFAADLAPMVRRFAEERRGGLFHVTNQGAVTWFEFARSVLAAAGADPERVRPIATAELDPPRAAPRPANSVLDNAALRSAGVPLLPDYREPLDRLVAELVSSR